MNDTPHTPSITPQMLMERLSAVEQALNKAILGKPELIRLFLTGVLAQGHLLLEGMPGLGKTLLARAFSGLCRLSATRIQFTPDLMPLDVTGSCILEEKNGARAFKFHPGPIFGNLVLADEINRASPKTQSALLEAMAERRVTVLGETHPLPAPFIVMATQNPIEMEGTYPLPEAQLDRFLFKLHVGDVDEHVLADLLLERGRCDMPDMTPILSQEELLLSMRAVESIPLSQPVAKYIARFVKATHPPQERREDWSADQPAKASPKGATLPANGYEAARSVRHGASPRAAIAIAMAARARAFLEKRQSVGFEDVKAVAPAALRHRIILDYTAKLDGLTPDLVLDALMKQVPELDKTTPESLLARL